MMPLFMDWAQLSQGYRAITRKKFTFLPLSPQGFLTVSSPLSAGGPEKFSMLAKKGGLALTF